MQLTGVAWVPMQPYRYREGPIQFPLVGNVFSPSPLGYHRSD